MKALINKRNLRLITSAFHDLFIRYFPINNKSDEVKFGFLVHPRNLNDVYNKYPFLKNINEKYVLLFLRFFWPIVVSKVTGLRNSEGKIIEGYIISIPLVTEQMLKNRKLTLKKILDALKLAEKLGVKIMGLGALTSSLTKGGLDLVDKTSVKITTGHAYTAYNVTSYFFNFLELYNLEKSKILVSIVGATGSIGSTSAKILARSGVNNLILIDLERKKHLFDKIVNELKDLNPNINVKISHSVGDVINSHFIITATNAPEALIKNENVSPGTVIIDDAQPSDVADDVLLRDDVIVVEAGAVHTPGIYSNFDMGLKNKDDNFCCMCEVMILAANNWNDNYVINRATLEHVDEISQKGKDLGFELAEFQNYKEKISQEKIKKVGDILKRKNVF